jgi:hypothetical protein
MISDEHIELCSSNYRHHAGGHMRRSDHPSRVGSQLNKHDVVSATDWRSTSPVVTTQMGQASESRLQPDAADTDLQHVDN